ncbi:NF-kappa-B-repressing factor-like [Odontomachus brunneus]|nr:NF-kappa-B-repressing factor-like [Odontomachus brunneus]
MTIEKTKSQDDIPDDNIGKKLMKLMGWSGGGLGKSQQGIMEPVTLKQQLSREGLGLKSSSSNMHELKAKCRIAFKEFLMGDMQNDIVFSTDFTNDERAMIHQVARSMGLKSRSHGPSDQRKLVISRKVNIRSLVEELKSLGGTTEKYELIEPTYLDDDELDSIVGTTEKDELIESTNLDEEMKDFEETTERYESIKPTSSVEELDKSM